MKRMSLLIVLVFSVSWGFGQTSCFTEGFSIATLGGDATTSSPSGTQWTTSADFPTVVKAYEAGGTIKLGNTTNPRNGSIESRALTEVEGDITVKLWVKGWTTKEANGIKVSIDGQVELVDYDSLIGNKYQLVTANFTGVTVGSKLKIETSGTTVNVNQRLFVDSIAVICATAPTCETATNLVATDNTNGSVTATWDAPTNVPADGYRVYIAKDGDAMPTTYFTTDNATTTFSTDTLIDGTALEDGETYKVYVVSVCDDANDEVSDTTDNTVTISIICGAITNLVTTDNTDGSVTATWDAPTNVPADGYRVYIAKDGDAMPTTYFTTDNATTTFSTDTLIDGTALTDGETYKVYVVAVCDDANDEVSDTTDNTVTVTIYVNPCISPTNLVVTNNTNGSITVTWDAPTPIPADGYRIFVTKAGGTVPATYFTTDNATTTFTTDTLENGDFLIKNEPYDVYVIAVCNDANNEVSDTVFVANTIVTNNTPCDAPTNIVVTNNNDGTITITWDAPATTPANGIAIAIAPKGTSPINKFDIAASETSFTTDTLTDGTILYLGVYDVYVVSDCGGANYSSITQDTVLVAYPVPCGEVTNLDAINNDNGSITVNWTAPMYLPAEGYKLAVVKNGDVLADTTYFTVGKNATTFTTDTLTNGDALIDSVTYVISIISVCHAASDSISNNINDTIMVTIAPEPCFAPTDLTITDNGYGELTATWTASASTTASNYQIAIVPQGTEPTSADFFSTSNTTFTSDTLADGTAIEEGNSYTVYVYTDCSTSLTSDTVQKTKQLSVEACATPTNLTVTKNADGSVSISWNAISPAPANGYYYAIGKAGVSLNFPADYKNTTATSAANVTQTTTGTDFEEGGIYTVYVLASCKAIHGDSPKATKNFTTTLDVNDVQSAIIGVYPNPANTFVTVALNTEKANITLVDMSGRTILTQTTTTATTQLDINHLPSGLYQMIVTTDATTSVVKFVKSN